MNQVASLCIIGIWLLRCTNEGSEEIMQLGLIRERLVWKLLAYCRECFTDVSHLFEQTGEEGETPLQLTTTEQPGGQSSSHPLKRSPYHSVSSLMNLTQSGARAAITQKHPVLSIFYLMYALRAPGVPINSCTELQQLTDWLLDYGPMQITTLTSMCCPLIKQLFPRLGSPLLKMLCCHLAEFWTEILKVKHNLKVNTWASPSGDVNAKVKCSFQSTFI